MGKWLLENQLVRAAQARHAKSSNEVSTAAHGHAKTSVPNFSRLRVENRKRGSFAAEGTE